MIGIVIAIAALALAVALSVAGWRLMAWLHPRLEALGQSIAVLESAHATGERDYSSARQRQTEADGELAALAGRLEDFETRFAEVESYAAVCVPPRSSNSGMNINRRVEVARLLGEGTSEEQISAELGVPLSEVRLIGHLRKTTPAGRAKHGGRAA